MDELILGSLRPAFNAAYTTIVGGADEEKTDTLRDGNKYNYYIDGIVVVIDTLGSAVPSKVLIDFSTLGEIKENLLVAYPYSLRGTRNNPNYIPLTKTSKTNEMPLLQKGKQFYYKILNNDANTITGVAIAILAYPVI